LGQLSTPIAIDIYLAGALPTDFKQLQYHLKALLKDIQKHTNASIKQKKALAFDGSS
jgi:NADH:ubiquinone oxidoreductase subunit B-like Fe-S oxidoreductase